jgi:hypothetical protein
MVMFEQSRRLSEPLRWGRREKAIVAALLSCVAVAAIALVIFGVSSGSQTRGDCVQVTFASTLGAAEVKGCGSRARELCASGADFRSAEANLKAACRRAGFPFSR